MHVHSTLKITLSTCRIIITFILHFKRQKYSIGLQSLQEDGNVWVRERCWLRARTHLAHIKIA